MAGQPRRFGLAFGLAWQTDPARTGCRQLSFQTPLGGLVQRLDVRFG